MYTLKPLVEADVRVTPASIMYRLKNIQRSLDEADDTLSSAKKVVDLNRSKSVPAEQVNGPMPPLPAQPSPAAAALYSKQLDVLKRLEALDSKLDALLKAKKALGKKETGKPKAAGGVGRKSATVAADSKRFYDVLTKGGRPLTLCWIVPPNDECRRLVGALLRLLQRRLGDVAVEQFVHNSVADVDGLSAPSKEPAKPTVVVRLVWKQGATAVLSFGPTTGRGGALCGEAVWKCVGALAGVCPPLVGAADAATAEDHWMDKAARLAHVPAKQRQAFVKQLNGRVSAGVFVAGGGEPTLADLLVDAATAGEQSPPANIAAWRAAVRAFVAQ